MVAAAIVPTVVQKTYVPSTGITGTPMRLVKYTFKGTKVTAADWINTATYFQSGTPIFWNACVIDSSTDGAQEGTTGLTYVNTGNKLTFGHASVGTVYGEIWFEE
ncbi:MAG: hypothetical protein ACTSRU_10585 [Candidatus Hodarchaeales archaeon]